MSRGMPRSTYHSQPLAAPVVEPLRRLGGRHEVLQLHLLELPGAEHEVPGRDLVAKRLADLGDPERRSLARRLQDVEEVDEVALGGLGPQVGDVALVLDRADVGLEHQVEGPGLGQVGAAAVGAVDQPVGRVRLEVVGPPALLAVAAVDQRIGEVGQVARGLPDLRAGQDGGVEADDVVAQLDHRPPPGVLDVAQHEHAERPVVVGGAEPAVDLRRGEHEAALLAQPHDVVHARRHEIARVLAGSPLGRSRCPAGPAVPAVPSVYPACPVAVAQQMHRPQPALEVRLEGGGRQGARTRRGRARPARAAPRPGRRRGCGGSARARPARAAVPAGAAGTVPRPRPGRSRPARQRLRIGHPTRHRSARSGPARGRPPRGPAASSRSAATSSGERRLGRPASAGRQRASGTRAAIGLALLGDLVDRLDHGHGVGQTVQVLAEGRVVLDRLGLGDDVELAALVEQQADPVAAAPAGRRSGSWSCAPLWPPPAPCRGRGQQHHDAVRLAQLVGPQHDAFVPVQAHGTYRRSS